MSNLDRDMYNSFDRPIPPGGKKPHRTLAEKLLKYERNGVGYEFIPILMHSLKRFASGKKGFNESRLEHALRDIPNAKALIKSALKAHDAIPDETKKKLFSEKYLNYDIEKSFSPRELSDVIKRSAAIKDKPAVLVPTVYLPKKECCCCDDSPETPPTPPKNRYEIDFDHLYCVDESDPEWWGSDEPYIVFAMITEEMVLNGTSAVAKTTPVYDDVDDGDRRPDTGSQNLRLYGFAGASPIESNLLIAGTCFEHDLGDVHEVTDKIRAALTSVAGTAAGAGGLAGWIIAGAAVIAIGISYLVDLWGADDQIGDTQEITLTQMDADNATSASSLVILSPMHFNGGDDAGIYDGYISLKRV